MEKGLFGDKMGRVHLGKQEFNEIAVAKLKGLKKQKTTEEQDKQMLNQDAQNQLPDVYSDDE
jgi:ribosome production factor 2